MAGCVCANAVVDPTWDAPWIDAMVFGQCPAPSQALWRTRGRRWQQTLCASHAARRFGQIHTRMSLAKILAADHFKATLNKNEPFNSWPPSTRPSLRSLPLLSFSLSLSLSLSLESLSLSLSSLSTAALSVCLFFPLSLSSLYRFSVSLARARSLSSLFFRFLLSGLLSLFSLPTSISLFFPPAPPLVFSFSLSFL